MANLGSSCNTSCCVNDSVCCTVLLAQGGATQTIWTNDTTFVANGTIVIENDGPTGGPSVNLVVNGVILTPPSPVAPGACSSVTVDNLSTIAVTPTGGAVGTSSSVKVSFSINYKF